MYKIYLILSFLTYLKIAFLCPPEDIVYPLNCTNNELHFGGKLFINITNTSIVISNWLESNNLTKNFKSLKITNTKVSVLDDNAFYDLTFDRISINGALNLEKLSKDAFKYSNISTKFFEISNGKPACNIPFNACSSVNSIHCKSGLPIAAPNTAATSPVLRSSLVM